MEKTYKYFISFSHLNGFGHHVIDINHKINIEVLKEIKKFLEEKGKIKEAVVINFQLLEEIEEENKCEYCELVTKSAKKGMAKYLFLEGKIEEPYIQIRLYDWEKGQGVVKAISPNYCPMCGKKLGGEI